MENPRSLVLFLESCKSKSTKKGYLFELDKFLKWAEMDYESVLYLENKELTDLLVDYALYLKKRVSPNSIPVFFAGVFKYFEMNDREFNKKKVKALFGEKLKRAGNRPITNEEINEMLRVCENDKQMALIQFLAATGCRPEAVSEMTIGNLERIGEDCMSVLVYEGSTHEHYAFLHSFAVKALERYHESRRKGGEKLTKDSPLFITHRILASAPIKTIHATTITGTFNYLMKKAGIERKKVGKNYDMAACGSFRKRFNTILKNNPDIPYAVGEKLMDHSNYLEKHYFQTTKEEMFEHYKKAIPQLIIEESERLRMENQSNQKELEELEMLRRENKVKNTDIIQLQQQLEELKNIVKNNQSVPMSYYFATDPDSKEQYNELLKKLKEDIIKDTD